MRALWLLHAADVGFVSVLGFARAGGAGDWLLRGLMGCGCCGSGAGGDDFCGFGAVLCGLSLSIRAADSGRVVCRSLIP